MRQIITSHYVRITRKQAKARFLTGQGFYIHPCNMHPESPWQAPFGYDPDSIQAFKKEHGNDFEYLCSVYAFYNCNSELGKYPAFYIDRSEYEERMKGNFCNA